MLIEGEGVRRFPSDNDFPLLQFGTVTECECIKNYAFVHMDDGEKASEAVKVSYLRCSQMLQWTQRHSNCLTLQSKIE